MKLEVVSRALLEALAAKAEKPKASPKPKSETQQILNGKAASNGLATNLSDEQLLAIARSASNGEKFKLLESGQWEGDYPSQSEADLAYCNYLAFYTGGDAERMERLWRRSGLWRDKSEHRPDNYVKPTIQKAIAGLTESYTNPEHRSGPPPNEGPRPESPRGEQAPSPGGRSTSSAPPEPDSEPDSDLELAPSEPFPEIAWRGYFDVYRQAMKDTTEASDIVHFQSLWAAAGATLGRRVQTFSARPIYANTYQSFFGDTGDKKTTAQKQALYDNSLIPLNVRLHAQLGSTEGLAEILQEAAINGEGDSVAIFFWEELSEFFAHASWKGSALLEFYTTCFDCPPRWGKTYKNKNAISVLNPTPSILSGTTPDWFWKNATPSVFHGGMGNRFLFLAGAKKTPNPNPTPPDAGRLGKVREAFGRLSALNPMVVSFDPLAQLVWNKFYIEWESKKRSGLYGAATKRIHVYVRKLAMTYAALEQTAPLITAEQLLAAVGVGEYAAECARTLIELKDSTLRPEGEIENKMLHWLKKRGGKEKKRLMQQCLSRMCGSCEVFNRTILNLLRAERIALSDGYVELVY
jgi:hypothetical protein